MKILWLLFVWPEPKASAAGFRLLQLMDACRSAGHELCLCSPCQSNDYRTHVDEQGIRTENFEPNDSAFDAFVREYAPDVVFFDRFMIEEQFSWRVREQCPNSVRILDTIDLHSLRRIRQKKIESGAAAMELSEMELQSEDALREIAAIYRSDLSLVVSDAEYGLLRHRYNIPEELLELCRFFYPCPDHVAGFEGRAHLMMIGNFNHPPNLDACRVLHRGLWKKIRKQLEARGVSGAELHLYGAYPADEIVRLDDPSSGFRVKGIADDSRETLSKYRINLAPLRFGAGIKGKITEGWFAGTPCVGTSIAAEGLHAGFEFGGAIEDDWDRFANEAAALYIERSRWEAAQSNGLRILRELFDAETNSSKFIRAIADVCEQKQPRRERNFIGAMLWHHQLRSTEFFSRWIEAKNKLK